VKDDVSHFTRRIQSFLRQAKDDKYPHTLVPAGKSLLGLVGDIDVEKDRELNRATEDLKQWIRQNSAQVERAAS
jgi:hypothetical protein